MSMKQAVFEALTGLLSPDTAARSSFEQRLKLFEVTDDYAVNLTELTLDSQITWPIRQLASVLLKQYVSTHWSKVSEKFQEPEVSPDQKQRIKALLLNSLSQDCPLTENGADKKLKSAVAMAISTIAHYDWPEDWPDLFQHLIQFLGSGNQGAIYGTMKVFVEICHEIIDTQIPAVAPLVLPKMLEIFTSTEKFSIRTRGRACQIFSYLSETIAVMNDFDKVSAKMYLDPVLPHFTEALVKILQVPDHGSEAIVDVGLKRDVLNCLAMLLKHYRVRLRKWMPEILQPVWIALTRSADLYVKSVINSDDEESIGVFDNPTDSDGEALSLESLIFSLFDFLSILIENKKTRKLIKGSMSDLIYYLLIYMQMSDEQMQAWMSSPDEFVSDEDEDSYSYSVRLSAQEVFLSLSTEFHENESEADKSQFISALIAAVKRHFSESSELKTRDARRYYYWWKIQESSLLALGSLSMSLTGLIKNGGPIAKELTEILDNVYLVPADASPFFAGRCLWTAARFAAVLSPPVTDRFLQNTAAGLVSDSPVYKICAVRATYTFVQYLSETNQSALLRPYLATMIEALIAGAVQFQTEVAALNMETISILIEVDQEFTATVEPKISALAIGTFIKHAADPVLVSLCQDIFSVLSKNTHTMAPLQSRLAPTLSSIINNVEAGSTAQTLQPVAIDIVTTIVRNSSLPLSDILMRQFFPAVIDCVLRSVDDNASMQNGGECVRAYLSCSPEQVVAFKCDQSGRDGLSMALSVCLHLLDPRVNESCSAFVGRLISVVITRVGSALGPDNIHLLLRSVLSKLQTSETLSVVQNLVMVFAHLFNHQMQTVLDFLSSLPGPTGGQSALEFVLTQWLSRQHVFFGNYDNKVCIVALCKLLEHSVSNFNSNDRAINLNLIQVPGEPVEDPNAPIRTRSKARNAPQQWTTIPCSVKIVKLLVNEIRICQEGHGQAESSDDESDDQSYGSGNDLSSPQKLAYGGDDLEDEEDLFDEEDDIIDEEIAKLNLEEYLLNFVRGFKQSALYGEFYGQLNQNEREICDQL